MKLRETFRFEIGYQARRVSTWAFVLVLLALVYRTATEGYVSIARDGGFHFNSPFIIASITLLGSLAGLLIAAATAGDAAARDVATRMHPLVYTTPVGKGTYLGGRFLAAFVLHAVILLAVPAALLLALRLPGLEPELIGPFRPEAYVGAYLFIALPNAFVTTALLFALAALSRRAVTSYLGGVVLFFGSMLTLELVARQLGLWELAKLLDPLGLTALSELSRAWTPIDKNVRSIGLEGSLLANRLLWMGIALGVLAFTHLRFRFAHPVAGGGWSRIGRRGTSISTMADADADPAVARGAPIAVPPVRRTFGGTTHAWQTLAVAGESFRTIVTSWGGAALAFLAVLLALLGPEMMEHMGVPLVPTTQSMVMFLGHPADIIWTIVPLMIVFYAGELVWRERESGLAEIADAAPLTEWVSLLGKFAGLGLVLLALQGLMMGAAMLTQVRLGYTDFQVGLYLQVLFGMQLADYLLFALLAMVVHVLVDHKYGAHGVLLIAYAFMTFAPSLGIAHNLLVYGSDPGWEYTDMRGFGPFLGPWLWFKLYWAAWALLLALAARLLWVRGRERGLGARLHLARRRLTRPMAGAVAVAAALVLGLGGFVFYNTNVLNEYRTGEDGTARAVAYERRYGRYADAPQPRVTGTRLHVEIHPRRRQVEIRGSYRLVNPGAAPIDTIHLSLARDVETGGVGFDRPAVLVRADEALGHRIYALRTPLHPGDSLRLVFGIRYAARGFRNAGIDPAVSADATYFTNAGWLPAIGYQPERELQGAGDRRKAGLPPRPAIRSLHDPAARHDLRGVEPVAFEAVVGTDAGQVAAAPGRLLRTWTEGGRRYFHYAADAPIRNEYAFYSAAYAVRTSRWTPPAGTAGRPVDIQVVHHPGHPWNVDRMIRGVRAALDYHAARFGPYPQGQIRLVERPGEGNSLHASPVNMWYQEGFALFDPDEDPRDLDFVFAVVAHEVAHQWWGNQLTPAYAEGGGILSESLAWYTAMGVVEDAHGPEHLRRLLGMLRELYRMPRARAAKPLLRADEGFQYYRLGPFALYTLREYVGEAAVDTALRRLLQKHGTPSPPLPTTLDLYRELRAVTPDSLRPLLADLFERNTFWELEADRATAQPIGGGAWRVTLEVEARKVVVDTAGVETERPMDDLVEVGVYAAAGEDGKPGALLYRRMHRVRSGAQRITVRVPREPARAAIDPRLLLIAGETDDNGVGVERGGASTREGTPR